MKFFAKVTQFDLNQVDKTIYKVDKTILVYKIPNICAFYPPKAPLLTTIKKNCSKAVGGGVVVGILSGRLAVGTGTWVIAAVIPKSVPATRTGF